jgi:hypothetical protein
VASYHSHKTPPLAQLLPNSALYNCRSHYLGGVPLVPLVEGRESFSIHYKAPLLQVCRNSLAAEWAKVGKQTLMMMKKALWSGLHMQNLHSQLVN